MHPMLIWIACDDYYDICQLFVLSGTFAVCKNHGTWQRNQCLPCAKAKAHDKHLNFAVCHASRAHGKVLATSSFLGATFFCRGSIVAHGKPFAVCPIYSTRQRPALLIPGCRVRFAMCGTRQRVYRGLLGLYRVPLAHGKGESPVVYVRVSKMGKGYYRFHK